MRASWFIKLLIEKCVSLFKYIKLAVVYHPDGFVHILGRVI